MSATGAGAPQTNGVPPSSGASTSQTVTTNNTQNPQSQPSQPTPATSQSQSQPPTHHQQQQQQPALQNHLHQTTTNPSTTAPRPRDARTVELLLTAQGVTSFEQRVPLLLLDFAYRHTSAVLSDALHLAADPYTSHAGSRPSAASGAAPVNVGDAAVGTNAVQLAIASRLNFSFRGGGGGGFGGGGGGGGVSKDWMMELARERNKVALPRISPNEWGTRLPGEKFVLSGTSWGLRDVWAGQEGAEESSEEEEGDEMMLDGGGARGADAMEVEEEVGGEGVEGGTLGDVFGDEGMEDEEMAEA
ncbi:transcription initiation factor IID, 31kD subunit-domain-containing protein [Chaetomidium leptoderma]|uniref:Transcription initiation factor IID, 31kD subunit-domain-containing protein n=1 Tax=Chaetomidium leptoderma TaxID=669021 RepID=A0AAN6VJY9_9PEZI|nr:transcription initiation factor IID, 31kD subunit-domain-containing protein [Chaetomidium leptoderma]